MLDAEALPILRIGERTTIGPLVDMISDEAVSGGPSLLAATSIGVDPFAAVTGSIEDEVTPGTMLRRLQLCVRFLGERTSSSGVEGRKTVAQHLQRQGVCFLYAWRLNVDVGGPGALVR